MGKHQVQKVWKRMRDSFVFYRSFLEASKLLPQDEILGLILALIEYALNDLEPQNLTIQQQMLFVSFKPQIDANKKRAEDGKKGGRPKKTIGFEDKNHRLSNEKPNVNVNDNVNDNVNIYKRKKNINDYQQADYDMEALAKKVTVN